MKITKDKAHMAWLKKQNLLHHYIIKFTIIIIKLQFTCMQQQQNYNNTEELHIRKKVHFNTAIPDTCPKIIMPNVRTNEEPQRTINQHRKNSWNQSLNGEQLKLKMRDGLRAVFYRHREYFETRASAVFLRCWYNQEEASPSRYNLALLQLKLLNMIQDRNVNFELFRTAWKSLLSKDIYKSYYNCGLRRIPWWCDALKYKQEVVEYTKIK